MAATEVQTLVAELILDTSKAQSALRDLSRKLTTFGAGDAAAGQAGSRAAKSWVTSFNQGIKGGRFTEIGGALAGGGLKFLERTVLATAAAGAVLEFQFIRVQDAQAAMARTLEGESAPALAKLNAEILELSKVIPVSITELYRIGEVAGTIGIAASSVAQFTDVVAKMAATTDLGVDEAAMGIGRLLNLFGFVDEKGQAVADQADNIASAMLKLSISQASTDQEILLATERFAALATQMGFLPAQILAISSTAAALGQRPEAIGGSIQRIFGIINKQLALGNEAIDEFAGKPKKLEKALSALDVSKMAAISGLSVQAFIKEWEKAPEMAWERFLKGFGQLSSQEQSLLFGTGKDAIFPSFVRGQQTLQGLAARVDLLHKAGIEAGIAYDQEKLLDEQAAVRFDTLKNNFVLLGNAITRGAVAFGSAFDEQLGGAIKRVTQYITENEGKFADWGRSVGKAIESIDWQQVAQFAQRFFDIFATGVKTTGDILALAPRLTGFLALLKVVDSLAGGNLSKVAGSLGSGVLRVVFDKFFARGSSAANPLWVQTVGGALGPGGAIRGALTAVLAVASIAALAAAIGGAIILAFKDAAAPGVADLKDQVDALANRTSGTASTAAIQNLTKVMNGFVHSNDLAANVQNLAKLWVSGGFDEATRAYEEAAANIVADSRLNRSEIVSAIDAMTLALDTGAVPPDAIPELTAAIQALRIRLRVAIGDNTREGRPSLLGIAERTAEQRAAHDAHEAHLDATNAQGIMETGFSKVAGGLSKLLEALKPRHRQGEKGKSIQSAEFAALNRLDPSRTGDINAYLADLIEHYTKKPIGTKGHERGFIMPAFKGIFPELKADLKAAMKTGGPGLDKMIANLQGLKHLGVHLPVGLRNLLKRAAEAQKSAKETGKETKDATRGVKSAVTDASDRIENLTAALRRKQLAVTVKPSWKANVKAPSVRVNPKVTVTIGARSITRYYRGTVAYGPGYVLMQTGTGGAAVYSGGGGY